MAEDSTPDEAEVPVPEQLAADDDAATGNAETAPEDAETVLGDAEQAIEDARRRLAEVPAEVVVTNHVMGLYELAAIHLSGAPPNLPAASLAIDAVGALVDGLGDRLGPDTPTLRDALANMRMAFVSVKSATARAAGGRDARQRSGRRGRRRHDRVGRRRPRRAVAQPGAPGFR